MQQHRYTVVSWAHPCKEDSSPDGFLADNFSLNGIVAGLAETIQPEVIAGIFSPSRPWKVEQSLLGHLHGIAHIGPAIAGTMAAHVGWRNIWWLTRHYSAYLSSWLCSCSLKQNGTELIQPKSRWGPWTPARRRT